MGSSLLTPMLGIDISVGDHVQRKVFGLTINVDIVWATLIVLSVAIGFATALVGLAITMPLVGHATWHAYRAVIRRADDSG